MVKTKIAGIIAEYNPFHSGHEHQIKMLKKQGFTHIIAVCSPGVVQRGQCSVFPTQERTKAALKAGVNLVISLPAPYALLSAEGFAKAAVEILCALNVCDYIAFGAETPKTALLLKTAQIINSPQYAQKLKHSLNEKMSYAQARQKALFEINEQCAKILKQPNNILAVEYCCALLNIKGDKPKPLALKRKGANHDEALNKSSDIASASALRNILQVQNEDFNIKKIKLYVPKKCYKIYKNAVINGHYLNISAYEIAVLSRLRALNEHTAENIMANSEGLHNALLKAISKSTSLNEIYEHMKSKRYAHSRIRRFVLNAALGFDENLPKTPPYIHALGISEGGEHLMKLIGKNAKLPFSASLSQLAKTSSYALAIANAHSSAEDLNALCLKNPMPCKSAFTQKFIDL